MSNKQKANYHGVATEGFVKGRRLEGKTSKIWLDLIKKYAKAKPGAKVLDLGCGHGRFAIPFAEQFGWHVTGADKFPEMLKQARLKDIKRSVNWEEQDAENLIYPPASFDVVFMSHLVHHLDDPAKTIADCYTILKPGGAIIIRYGSMEQIRHDVEHTFFPETVAIDKARTPSNKQLENWLKEAGYKNVKSHIVFQNRFFAGPEDHLERVRTKFTSVLTMISEEAFARGSAKLEDYIKQNPDDPWLVNDYQTLSVGYV